MQTAIKPSAHCNELNASFNEADYKLYVQVDCGCSVLLFIALCILMDVVCVQELNLSWFHRNLVQCSLRVTLRNGVINIYLSIYLSVFYLSIYLSIYLYVYSKCQAVFKANFVPRFPAAGLVAHFLWSDVM